MSTNRTSSRVRAAVRERMAQTGEKYTAALAAITSTKLLLGYADDQPTYWDLSVDPHLTVVGAAGQGKSVLARSLAAQAVERGWTVRIAVPHRGDDSYDFLEGRATVARGLDAGFELVSDVVQRLGGAASGARELIIIDGLGELAGWPDADVSARDRFYARARRLAREGRGAGIHTVFLTQHLKSGGYANMASFRSDLLANSAHILAGKMPPLAVRIALGVAAPEPGEEPVRGQAIYQPMSGASLIRLRIADRHGHTLRRRDEMAAEVLGPEITSDGEAIFDALTRAGCSLPGGLLRMVETPARDTEPAAVSAAKDIVQAAIYDIIDASGIDDEEYDSIERADRIVELLLAGGMHVPETLTSPFSR